MRVLTTDLHEKISLNDILSDARADIHREVAQIDLAIVQAAHDPTKRTELQAAKTKLMRRLSAWDQLNEGGAA